MINVPVEILALTLNCDIGNENLKTCKTVKIFPKICDYYNMAIKHFFNSKLQSTDLFQLYD
jgi:hypothetical protein